MSQLRMGKIVHENPEDVLEKAIAFFGKQGVGLILVRHTSNDVYFTHGGGHVQVMVNPVEDGQKTEIDVQTVEWEYDVKKFMESI